MTVFLNFFILMIISSDKELELLRQSGRILAGVLQEVSGLVRVGVITDILEQRVRKLISQAGAAPSFLGFRGYPNALCVSMNEEVVHGLSVPPRTIQNGDVVGLDCGVNYRGMLTDAAMTIGVGTISSQASNLIRDTEKSLTRGIKVVRAGCTTGDIGSAISKFLKIKKYGIVTALSGHGVGKEVHEPPEIINIGYPGQGEKLVEGQVIAIEPMVTLGSGEVVFDSTDHWTVRTKDHTLAAHFEHTVVVTKGGCEILTL